MMPTNIIIHHSLTKDSDSISWDAIRRFHTSWRYNGRIVSPEEGEHLKEIGRPVTAPWRDIGYHWGIERVGEKYKVLPGRPECERGAHCAAYNMNASSIGICLVGNFDLTDPPEAQWNAAIDLVASISDRLSIPVFHVYGHGEIELRKSCPGKRFSMERFRRVLRQRRREALGITCSY